MNHSTAAFLNRLLSSFLVLITMVITMAVSQSFMPESSILIAGWIGTYTGMHYFTHVTLFKGIDLEK